MSKNNGVSVNWGGLDKSLQNGVTMLTDKRRELLEEVGEVMTSSAKKRFNKGEGPDGDKWQASRRAREGGGKTLLDTAHLRNSITSATTDDAVLVGSNVEYARIHQLGGKAGRNHATSIEPRPYLGVSADDLDEIQAAVAHHIASAFGGGK